MGFQDFRVFNPRPADHVKLTSMTQHKQCSLKTNKEISDNTSEKKKKKKTQRNDVN